MDRPTREQVETALEYAEMRDAPATVALDDFYNMPQTLAAEVRALREENETLREGLDEALKPQQMSDEALRDWLDALKSQSDHPEVIAIQRGLVDIIDRAARQLPEVEALVKAARAALEEDSGMYASDALAEALKPFEDKSHG